jgi:hypothetical protein
MTDVDDATRRITNTTSRIDAFFADHAEQERRRVEDDRRNQHLIDSATNRETQQRFDQVLEQFGERMSPPVVGEDPAAYQRHAMLAIKRKLARADERSVDTLGTSIGEIAAVTVKHLPNSLLDSHEQRLAAAAKLQADAPHHDTLPPAGEFMTITKTDSMTGAKAIHHYGKESFIKGLSRPGQLVTRIVDPVNKLVVWGRSYERV